MVAADALAKKHKDVDPFLIKKWKKVFTMFFDRNGSGEVDAGDFYLVVRKVRDVYGAESVQMSYARKSLNALFEGLCKLADNDGDQQISVEEWVNLLKRIYKKQNDKGDDPKWFNDYRSFLFKLFDVSGDGVLDVSEYADGMSLYGKKFESCREAFSSFAVDDKGNPQKTVTPEQWNKRFQELFFSKDKNARGNNLFGKLEN
ncbi:Protein CEX-1 [Aphelenchoides avenae]|nr:Protein CEX-1 [Aphelenchus avenae]